MNLKSSPGTELDDNNQLAAAEAWLVRYGAFLALLIIIAGLVPRLYWSWGCYLNPDEAMHLGIAAEPSLGQVYLRSRPLAHPPLFTILLHFFVPFVSSELLVRLPWMAAATLGSWFGYRWAERIFGTGTALGILTLMTFLPGLMLPAVEVRQYGLLVMGICGALCFLERGLDEDSGRWLCVGYLLLYIAILSHYSALWITAAISCYSLVRLYQLKVRPGIWMTWFGCQSGAGMLYLGLYITQISKMNRMQSGTLKEHTSRGYLSQGYYYGEDGSPIDFAASRIHDVFSYLAGGNLAGSIALFLFAAGLITLLVATARRNGAKRPEVVLLLLLPMVFGFIGTLLYLVPFFGSRHVIYMFPFLAVGIAVGFLRWIRCPAIASILLALVAPFWMISALNDWGYAPNNNPFKMPRQDMVEALRFLEEEVPGNEALLVDYQTLLTLNYYWKADSRRRKTSSAWAFDRESLFELLEEASGTEDAVTGGSIWVMSVGWWRPPLTEIIPESMIIDFHKFGWIGLVQIRVPPELPKPESH